jgi:hypothetical protein
MNIAKKRKKERKLKISVDKYKEKLKPVCTAGRNVKWYSHYGKQ